MSEIDIDAVKRVRGNNINALLHARGWTEAELGLRCGMEQSYVNRIKNGGIPNPRVGTAMRIARAFGVPVEDVFEEEQ